MNIAELCTWAGVAHDTPRERLEGALRDKSIGWAGEGATLASALEGAMGAHGRAEARLADLKSKKVPPNSPAWRLAEADAKKWAQRLEVARLLVELDRFQEARVRLDQLAKEGKRNQAKREVDRIEELARTNPEFFEERWKDIEAMFLDAFGSATPAATPVPAPPRTPTPAPAPPAPITDQSPSSPPSAPVVEDLDERMRVGDTVHELRAGRRVFGRYRLEKVIGRGGMGVVWLAKDERLDRPVALKFLPEIVRLDAGAVRDLKRETQQSLRLTHEHIVRIHDYVEDGELAAISMEYVDGPTLTTLRAGKEKGVFEVGELRAWVRQLGEALEYAHTKAKVVHRDLKPANLMVNGDGDLKVTDFGISRSLSESFSRVSMGSATGGTPMYMSPQQALGEMPSTADDVYGVGATLYELLTGKPPFHSGNVQAQLERVVPPLASERRKEFGIEGEPVPGEWDRAIAACLEKDAAKRPSSVRELVNRLESLTAPAAPSTASSELTPSQVASSRAKADISAKPEPVRARPEPRPTNEVKIEAVEQGPEPGQAQQEPRPTGKAKRLAVAVIVLAALSALTYWATHRPRPKAGGAALLELAQSRPRFHTGERFTNSLGMVFAPVPGAKVLFSIWETRVRDYAEYAKAASGVDTSWKDPTCKGKPVTPGPTHPVVNVGWTDAKAFCRWLTEKERRDGMLEAGQEYRLPTDLDWSAAVGLKGEIGSTPRDRSMKIERVYPWGKGWPPPAGAGNYADRAAKAAFPDWAVIVGYDDAYATTSPVGSFKPNEHGLFDLGGNVWEWCEDWYDSRQKWRTLRGGSWNLSIPDYLLASYRGLDDPGSRVDIHGFRCVLAASGSER